MLSTNFRKKDYLIFLKSVFFLLHVLVDQIATHLPSIHLSNGVVMPIHTIFFLRMFVHIVC